MRNEVVPGLGSGHTRPLQNILSFTPAKDLGQTRTREEAEGGAPSRQDNGRRRRVDDWLLHRLVASCVEPKPGCEVEVDALLGAVEELDPQSPLETALASQALAAHSYSMRALSRATRISDPEIAERWLRLAMKLMATYRSHFEALQKAKGKGPQQIEVRHVHVHGQAVVGDVHVNQGGR